MHAKTKEYLEIAIEQIDEQLLKSTADRKRLQAALDEIDDAIAEINLAKEEIMADIAAGENEKDRITEIIKGKD